MVTIEVNLKEGDEEPEQHLDEGEHIERVVVPLDQLYEKLQGSSHFLHFSTDPHTS
jgi:ADP-ribose pyrophosphatase